MNSKYKVCIDVEALQSLGGSELKLIVGLTKVALDSRVSTKLNCCCATLMQLSEAIGIGRDSITKCGRLLESDNIIKLFEGKQKKKTYAFNPRFVKISEEDKDEDALFCNESLFKKEE